MLRIFVAGIPRPAGSKRAIPIYAGKKGTPDRKFTGRTVVVDDAGQKGKDWRADIQHAVRQIYNGGILEGPVVVNFRFVFPRPKSHYRTGKNAHILKDDAPKYHTSRPDALKVSRAVEDALTGIVWRDDSQIIDEKLVKEYGDNPGVHIRIASIYNQPEQQRSLFDGKEANSN
jgi:Holliday junction resolvase RusA-like endonuclease